MKQPVLGLVASAIGIVLALAFISRFSLPAFNGPVAFHLLCAIPFQVMAVVIWGANPSFVAKLSQPGKGRGAAARQPRGDGHHRRRSR